MSDKTLTYERAKELLLQVIEGREDYVYQNPNPEYSDACYNHWEGKPSCLIGHAIAADGIDLVGKVDDDADAAGAVQSAYGQGEENAVRLWMKAQVYQDSGVPWGKAVQRAINVVEREEYS